MEQEGQDMPQLDFNVFLPQIFWSVFFFLIIFLFMTFIVFPMLSKTIEDRRKIVLENIQFSKNAQKEANQILENYHQFILNAQKTHRRMLQDTTKEVNEKALIYKNNLLQRTDTEISELEKQLWEEKQKILENLKNISFDIVAQIYYHLFSKNLPSDVLEKSCNPPLNKEKH